jgi:hypothetical protein
LLVTRAVVRQMNHHLARSVSTEPAAIALLAEIRFQAPQSLTDGHWLPFLFCSTSGPSGPTQPRSADSGSCRLPVPGVSICPAASCPFLRLDPLFQGREPRLELGSLPQLRS